MNIKFRCCPHCAGYGVRDNGKSCKTCSGSGELMYDAETQRQITTAELVAMAKLRDESKSIAAKEAHNGK